MQLLAGTAELFGTELAASQTYTFSGTKAAIYTWHGCTLEISAGDTIDGANGGATATGSGTGVPGLAGPTRGYGAGGCQSEYVAEETPMVEYANVHFALETLRQEAKTTGKDGPRVLIVGPENAGKTSLAKILTAYATKMERQPIVVNLDPTEGMLSVPGTLTATAFRTMIDVEEGWGNSPMSGPSPVPVKLPLVYFYTSQNPLENEGALYRPVLSRLALSVMGRMAEDEDARETGIIVDTPGILGHGKPGSLELINHIVTEFSSTSALILLWIWYANARSNYNPSHRLRTPLQLHAQILRQQTHLLRLSSRLRRAHLRHQAPQIRRLRRPRRSVHERPP